LGSELPARRRLEPAVGFRTTHAPTAGVHRWVRNYSSADCAGPTSGTALPKRESAASNVGYRVTQARVGGVQRRVPCYPSAGRRRPTSGGSLPKRRPPRSNVGYGLTQAPISGVQRWVGGIGDWNLGLQRWAAGIGDWNFDLHRRVRHDPSAKPRHECFGRRASWARQRRARCSAASEARAPVSPGRHAARWSGEGSGAGLESSGGVSSPVSQGRRFAAQKNRV